MAPNDQDYFDFVVKSLKKFGLHSSCRPLQRHVHFYLLLLLITLHIMILINLKNCNNVFEMAENFESLFAFAQLLVRKLILLIHNDSLQEIIQNRRNFWKYDLFGEELEKQLHETSKTSFKIYKGFFIICCIGGIVTVLGPFFVKEYLLPLQCWIPGNETISVSVIYIIESLFLTELILITTCFDAFFFLSCTDVTIQIRLLTQTVISINIGASSTEKHIEQCFKTLQECSLRYNFLVGMHKNINKVFSMYFLFQFLLNVIGLSMEFYIITDSSSNIMQKLRSVSFIAVMMVLNAIIFIPPTKIEIEIEDFVSQVYNVDWYNDNSLKIGKFIRFWLMRVQRPLTMSGAGLFYLNRNVLLEIPRIAFSICTLLR